MTFFAMFFADPDAVMPPFLNDATPPSANFISLSAVRNGIPYRSTAAARNTNSPSESHAGIESDVDVPGPEIAPPAALYFGLLSRCHVFVFLSQRNRGVFSFPVFLYCTSMSQS